MCTGTVILQDLLNVRNVFFFFVLSHRLERVVRREACGINNTMHLQFVHSSLVAALSWFCSAVV